MNKKELSEIRTIFNPELSNFDINRISKAFISNKTVKFESEGSFPIVEEIEADFLVSVLRKVIGGSLGKTIHEYAFSSEAYNAGEIQNILYKMLNNEDFDVNSKALIQKIAEGYESNGSSYAVFVASCTYYKTTTRWSKKKSEEPPFRFLIAAVCGVVNEESLIYDDSLKEIIRKKNFEKILKHKPSNGFMFPCFSNREADVNSILCFRSQSEASDTFIRDVLECKYTLAPSDEKKLFNEFLETLEVSYDELTLIKSCLRDYVSEKEFETAVPLINKAELMNMIEESGVGAEREQVSQIYDTMIENNFNALDIMSRNQRIITAGVELTVSEGYEDSISVQIVNGKKCLVIALEEPSIEVDGIIVKE